MSVVDCRVIEGDCLGVLETLPADAFDLAYLDPPFNTGRRQHSPVAAYDDRWPDMPAYLAWMRPRLAAVIERLTPAGVLLLHCDWRTSHHQRVLLEDLLDPACFVNHLVWSYGLGGSSPRRFARKHDDILFFARSPDYWFEPPLVPARSARMRGQLKKATDVLDIPSLNNMALERTGYPTQKPLALLQMLVGACAPPGGRVLDPFCGSGTTLVAAAGLGRSAVGIDRSPEACTLARARCEEVRPVTPSAGNAVN